MKLESQVTSLEVSQKLKTLGVKQESLYYHIYWDWNLYGLVSKEHMDSKSEGGKIEFGMDRYSAFTVAELGEMLPQGVSSFLSKQGGWRCIPPVLLQHHEHTIADTEADARGKMLIYLLENKLVTL